MVLTMNLETGYQRLEKEINRLDSENKCMEIWWRDDDLEAPNHSLENMISVSDNINLAPLLARVDHEGRPFLTPRQVANHWQRSRVERPTRLHAVLRNPQ